MGAGSRRRLSKYPFAGCTNTPPPPPSPGVPGEGVRGSKRGPERPRHNRALPPFVDRSRDFTPPARPAPIEWRPLQEPPHEIATPLRLALPARAGLFYRPCPRRRRIDHVTPSPILLPSSAGPGPQAGRVRRLRLRRHQRRRGRGDPGGADGQEGRPRRVRQPHRRPDHRRAQRHRRRQRGRGHRPRVLRQGRPERLQARRRRGGLPRHAQGGRRPGLHRAPPRRRDEGREPVDRTAVRERRRLPRQDVHRHAPTRAT